MVPIYILQLIAILWLLFPLIYCNEENVSVSSASKPHKRATPPKPGKLNPLFGEVALEIRISKQLSVEALVRHETFLHLYGEED